MSTLPRLAYDNNKEEIVRLLQQGADINEQDSNGYTALLLACQYNHTEIVEILLKHNKINVNLKDTGVFLMNISGGGDSPFLSACANNRYECVRLMIQDPRVDINMADDFGVSPLMWACYFGKTKTVQLLISYGRSIDIYKKSTKDWNCIFGDGLIKSGSTVLDVAKQRNKTDIVQFLEQYQNNPKETQKTTRNQLNLKGKINK